LGKRISPGNRSNRGHSQRFDGGLRYSGQLHQAYSPQRLLRPQQLRPRRVQMHILAHRAEVARRVRVHRPRLVAPAEQVPAELVPPCLRAARTGRRLNRRV
jgi:hypothetical protein